jgi:hypothetical protein
VPAQSPSERSLIGSIAANSRWAYETDRSAATAPARAALQQKFLDAAGGDPVRAANLRTAHFRRLALRSAQSRRKAGELTAVADAADQELEQLATGTETGSCG